VYSLIESTVLIGQTDIKFRLSGSPFMVAGYKALMESSTYVRNKMPSVFLLPHSVNVANPSLILPHSYTVKKRKYTYKTAFLNQMLSRRES
jgi:hypothetical protein